MTKSKVDALIATACAELGSGDEMLDIDPRSAVDTVVDSDGDAGSDTDADRDRDVESGGPGAGELSVEMFSALSELVRSGALDMYADRVVSRRQALELAAAFRWLESWAGAGVRAAAALVQRGGDGDPGAAEPAGAGAVGRDRAGG